jgi:hypothetical protein
VLSIKNFDAASELIDLPVPPNILSGGEERLANLACGDRTDASTRARFVVTQFVGFAVP